MNRKEQLADQKHMIALATCRQICCSMPTDGNYITPATMIGVVTNAMRKTLGFGEVAAGREFHLKMLSWIFGREITTTKVGTLPGQLKSHEAMGLLKWAQPAKITDNAPWTVNKRVKETCTAFLIVHLGQQEMFNAITN